MRILITGSRDWRDADTIRLALTMAASRLRDAGAVGSPVLVSGGASGADRMAEGIAREMGWTVERHPADWPRHGKAAGHIRNGEMVAAGADVCLAFAMPCLKCPAENPVHDSHGTWHCANEAARAGIPVRWYRKDRAET